MKRFILGLLLIVVATVTANAFLSQLVVPEHFAQKQEDNGSSKPTLADPLFGQVTPFHSQDWRDIKAQNLEALRQASRQLRAKKCDGPNLILISAGDLGYGDVPPPGERPEAANLEHRKQVHYISFQEDNEPDTRARIQTPNLRRMANAGTWFRQYYAGGSTVVPSVCSAMTGLHTGHCRLRGDRPEVPLESSDLTIAEVLWKAGYSTGMIGLWPLGKVGTSGAPNQQGFDYSFGYMSNEEAKNYYPPFLWRNNDQVLLEGNRDGNKEQFSNDLITDEALTFIERNRRRSFFMYLTYTMPRPDVTEVPSLKPYEDLNWTQEQKAYAAMITRLDGYVGRILDRLEELDLADNSIVLFSPDNGPQKKDPDFFQSSGPFRGSVGTVLEGGLRIPMIAWGPGRIRAGQVSDHVWAAWDLMPTLADLANAWRRPQGIDGISQVAALTGGVAGGHDYLYWEMHHDGFEQAIRMGKWKAIRKGFGAPIQLYDLTIDRLEEHNVASDHPEVVEKIKGKIVSARTASPNWKVE